MTRRLRFVRQEGIASHNQKASLLMTRRHCFTQPEGFVAFYMKGSRRLINQYATSQNKKTCESEDSQVSHKIKI